MQQTSPRSTLIVIKLGTSSICDEKTFIPKLSNLSLLVETVVELRNLGHRVVLVTSGAVGVGLRRLGLPKRPKHLSQVQAVAAVGQGRLMALYDSLFSQFGVPIGQILLTRDNLSERSPYLNAQNTIRELLSMSVVPIINENDSVSSCEIRFGDNDSLSAIVAGMIHADYLFLLTDVDGLYTDNPRNNPNAQRIKVVRDIPKLREQGRFKHNKVNVASAGSQVGTGGMVTKLIAAELATSAGCNMIITIGSAPKRIFEIFQDLKDNETYERDPIYGTHFVANAKPMDDRLWWISHSLAVAGTLYIDAGATKAVTRKDKGSLFAAGIKKVQGNFNAQECVLIIGIEDEKEIKVAKGLVNYSSNEIQRLLGVKSRDIPDILGYMDSEFVIHRDNLAVLPAEIARKNSKQQSD